jgi:sugar phosphate isomerase/epimerase
MSIVSRRNFLRASSLALAYPAISSFNSLSTNAAIPTHHVKLTLNAYSFNEALQEGEMSLEEMIDYAAHLNFDAVDLTGYYFPGYPDVPSKDYINKIKRKTFLLGLDISGTGVRNDFALPDEAERKQHIAHVKEWIIVAAEMGAPMIRVFAGRSIPDGYTREQAAQWVIDALAECADFGSKYGVMVGLQNHNDFIVTTHQYLDINERVASDWFGLMVDIGSFDADNPYVEISKAAPYAISWQIKEHVLVNGNKTNTDFKQIVEIVKGTNYRGYLPLETLGPGDPKTKMEALIKAVRAALK